jgi:hypothetical protein
LDFIHVPFGACWWHQHLRGRGCDAGAAVGGEPGTVIVGAAGTVIGVVGVRVGACVGAMTCGGAIGAVGRMGTGSTGRAYCAPAAVARTSTSTAMHSMDKDRNGIVAPPPASRGQ